MCNNETHFDLPQPAHFIQHTMEVEKACSIARRRGLGGVSLEQVQREADEALRLVYPDVTSECTRMLHLAASGNLQQAAQV